MTTDLELENLLKDSLPRHPGQYADWRRAGRTCEWCGNTFTPTRKWQTFCSDSCRKAKHTKTVQEAFERMPARIEQLEEEVTRLQEENRLLKQQLERM